MKQILAPLSCCEAAQYYERFKMADMIPGALAHVCDSPDCYTLGAARLLTKILQDNLASYIGQLYKDSAPGMYQAVVQGWSRQTINIGTVVTI